jgi:peptidoglycan/xylan/chitin deacetylase (PgdA/CDA1 family)
MKQEVVSLLHSAGVFTPFRLANRSKALVLMYHRFSESETEAGFLTTRRSFQEQLDYLTTHYKIVPLSELIAYWVSGARIPPGLAAITIDDGYVDAYELAFPILRERKLPATVFVVTDFVDRKCWLWTDKLRYATARAEPGVIKATVNLGALGIELNGRASRLRVAQLINSQLKLMQDDAKEKAIIQLASRLGVDLPDLAPPEFSSLTWEQAREMDSAGIEIGSHTVTHPILTKIGNERLRYELCESRSRLEAMLGHKVELLGYPNGDYDVTVQRETARAGYRCAVTVEYGFNNRSSDPLAVRRIHTEHDMARFAKNTSGFEQFKNILIHRRSAAARPAEQSADLWM